MKEYILRIEAVNLSGFIEDTQDLNTIRGGGLLLLDATHGLLKKFKTELTPVSIGASTGIYKFDAKNDNAASQMRKSVAQYLSKPVGDMSGLSHATFVVDCIENKNAPIADYESVLALNRWRQFQQITIPLPASDGNKACELDDLRPGVIKIKRKGKEQWVSESVNARRQYGKDKKNTFYHGFIDGEITDDLNFISNFEDLTYDPDQQNLHHKMAVVYLDGNGFGKIRKDFCKSWEDQKEFDKRLRGYQKNLLGQLLNKVQNESGWHKDRSIRLETLLWGGDEYVWVVPAWKGWETLKFFFKNSRDWVIGEQYPLTHAGGIIFCHHNAPIHGIVKTAKSLADAAKEKAKKYDRYGNVFQYLVLESFDSIGTSLESYRDRFNPFPISHDLTWDKLDGSFCAEKLEDYKQKMSSQEMPKRQIYKGIQAAIADHACQNATNTNFENFLDRLRDLGNFNEESKITGEHLYHLQQIWDYLPEAEGVGA